MADMVRGREIQRRIDRNGAKQMNCRSEIRKREEEET